mmetsp:Transcript_27687/g.60543  ORF Transcript_27687/g.60543 Transcript_27687/m.60543 type:complete len:195 (+) Transcript_27687:197-781(+)
MQFGHQPLLQGIASSSRLKIDEFQARSLSNLAWSFAVLQFRDSPLIAAISEALLATGHIGPQAKSGEVLIGKSDASATRRHQGQAPRGASFSPQRPSLLVTFAPSELAIFAWSFATLECMDVPLWHALAEASMKRIASSEFEAQQLAITAWSFAALKLPHAPLLACISASSLSPIADFAPQNLANLSWAYAVLP